MCANDKMPVVFTPDNEPYLGRESLFRFDQIIVWCMENNGRIAEYTRVHAHELNATQRAACQLIPQGINLTLTIRELVRQGYLFGAAVLLRPLIERAAIISYIDETPGAVDVWEDGWKYKERPRQLATMLKVMRGSEDDDDAQAICDTLNHLTHGDPMSADFNLVELGEDGMGYSVGKVLNNPKLCDYICFQTYCYLIVLVCRAVGIFPQADIGPPPISDMVH